MQDIRTEEKVQVKECKLTSSAADTAVVVVCAGDSVRMGRPKMFSPLLNHPVFAWTVMAADNAASTAEIIVVVRQQDIRKAVAVLKGLDLVAPVCVVAGGATRQESVQRGLEVVSPHIAYVAVQDGARPLTPSSVYELVAAHVRMDPTLAGAIAARHATDSLKVTDEAGTIVVCPNRDPYWYAETPQIFHKDVLKAAYRKALAEHATTTDDAAVVKLAGGTVACVEITAFNLKITYPDDLIVAERFMDTKLKEEASLGW